MDKENNTQFDFIKYLPIGSTFVLGLLYFFGFIVNLYYFSQYGISTIALIKVQYLLAGFWVLLPIILFALLLFSILDMWIVVHKDNKNDIFDKIKYLSETILLFIGMIIFLFYQISSFFNLYTHTIIDWGALIAPIIFVSIILILVFKKFKFNEKHMNFLFIFSIVIAMNTYLIVFAGTIYKDIPLNFGGGKPEIVQFIIKDEKNKTSLPIELASSSNKSIPYKLLLETDKTYVILPNNNQVKSIELNRDLFAGIIYLSE